MTVQHVDLFHCLACGRVAYELHGGSAPDCCGQPMVCAVADVITDVPASAAFDAQVAGDGEEHALFAEMLELSQWCHRLQDVDISRSEELANRLSVLHQALIDQLEDPQCLSPQARADQHPVAAAASKRLLDQSKHLLATFARFVAQLRSGPSPFGNWAQICDRMDELVADFRSFVRAEHELARVSQSGGGDSDR